MKLIFKTPVDFQMKIMSGVPCDLISETSLVRFFANENIVCLRGEGAIYKTKKACLPAKMKIFFCEEDNA